MYYYYYFYAVYRAHEAAHVFRRAGPGRGPCDVVTTATSTTFLGVPGSLSAKNNYVRTMHFWQIAAGV